jgi:cholesterol transport system auxiliary component
MIAPGRRVSLVLCSLAMAWLASGCSWLRSSAPAVQVYPLRPAVAGASAAVAAAAQPAAAALGVVLPVAAPGLNTNNIALLRADGVLDAYAASRWPELLPEVLQPLIIDALRAGGRFASVQADTGPFRADYLLQVEVRQFAAVYAGDVKDSAPTVQVQLVVTLGRRADRSVLHSFVVNESAPASANRVSAVVAAFDSALGAALQKVVAEARVAQ